MKTFLKISPRGEITLPAKLRRSFGMSPGGQILAELTPEGLLLRPAATLPVEIYNDQRIAEFDATEKVLDDYLCAKLPATTAR